MPKPKKCAHIRLARFLAKYGFLVLVSQSASSWRGERSGDQSGSVPSKKRATTILSVFGMVRRFLSACGWIGPTKLGRVARQRIELGEEGRELPELRSRVGSERVIVALGTLELHAEEEAADGRAEVLGFGLVRLVKADQCEPIRVVG